MFKYFIMCFIISVFWNNLSANDTLLARPESISPENEVLNSNLPNGIAVIPDTDSSNLCIFSFHEGGLIKNPCKYAPIKTKSEKERFDLIQREKAGDVLYDDAEGGVIVFAFQTAQRFPDTTLGKLCSQKITPALSKESRLKISLGDVFLVPVNSKHYKGKITTYALFRILGKTRKGLQIQWIYQPDGTTCFNKTDNALSRKIMGSHWMGGDIRFWVHTLRSECKLRICFIPASSLAEQKKLGGWALGNTTVKGALDLIVRKCPEYQWKWIDGTNIFCIYPRTEWYDKPYSDVLVKSGKVNSTDSWIKYVAAIDWKQRNIIFPPSGNMGKVIPLPPDRIINLNLQPTDTVIDMLGKICWTYGENMFFNAEYQPYDKADNLYFLINRECF